MSVTIRKQENQKVRTKRPKPSLYFKSDAIHDNTSELSVYDLLNHVKEALEKAETIIRNGFPSMEEVKKIIEENVKEKLEGHQDIKYIEYYFDESIPWKTIKIGDTEISRAYDAVDTLRIGIANGPEILIAVQADYVIATNKDKEHVIYFKINKVEVDSVHLL